MQTNIQIREIKADDIDLLAQFFDNNNQPAITKHFHPFPLTYDTACTIATTRHRDRYYVAIDNKIIGFCMLRGWDEGYEIPSFGVLVDHHHQGQGLGRKLTEFAISEAEKLSCKSVRLSVYTSNTRALHLYRSLKFKEISRQEISVDKVTDTKIVMLRTLT